MEKKKNIFLSVVTSGSTKYDEIMNFAMKSDGELFYAERTDFDLNKVNHNQLNLKIMDFQHFTYKDSYQEQVTGDNGIKIVTVKEHDNIISGLVKTYLEKWSDQGETELVFWVDNPVAWFYFIGLIFPDENGIPYIPEYVLPYPMDLNTMFQFAFEGKTIDDYYPNLTDEIEFNSLPRSQYLEQLTTKIFFDGLRGTPDDTLTE